jgi:hypothetical protein
MELCRLYWAMKMSLDLIDQKVDGVSVFVLIQNRT